MHNLSQSFLLWKGETPHFDPPDGSQETTPNVYTSQETPAIDDIVGPNIMSSLVEKLCLTVMPVRKPSLVEKLCPTVNVSQKTAVLMMMNSFVMVREILIEDYQKPALIWHQDQNRHTWSVSPGLLLMMDGIKNRNSALWPSLS